MFEKLCVFALLNLGLTTFTQAINAQTLTGLRVDSTEVAINTPIRAFVEFESSGRDWCGFFIDWGDGKDPQSFRIGRRPDITPPVSRVRTYEKEGTYVIKAYGDFVQKGLNSATKCAGRVDSVTIRVFDPAKNTEAKSNKPVESESQEEQSKRTFDLEKLKLELAQKELELKAKELELERQRLNAWKNRDEQEATKVVGEAGKLGQKEERTNKEAEQTMSEEFAEVKARLDEDRKKS